jgi:HD-GYP domain-containing protein (c-di-GMP phosphodiesterase class II)
MLRTTMLLASAGLVARERRSRKNVERLGAATLEALLGAVDANSPATGAHVRRVASYSLILADAADLDDHACHAVERVALFHDIGKLDGAVTDIVDEPGKLTSEEWQAVRTHPARGARVLKPLDAFYPELSRGVLAHHERWDGSGYPRGLRGEEIPFSARIVMIADTFDAMTHKRSYSKALSLNSAAKLIADSRGTLFDPDLVDLFLSPPVIERIRGCMRSARSPRRAGEKLRSPATRRKAPDINFRWRKQAP